MCLEINPFTDGHRISKGDNHVNITSAANVFKCINKAGKILLSQFPWKPMNAASNLMDGIVAWCPVA